MRRREFFGVLGGAATMWAPAAHAQQGRPARHIGALLNLAEGDAAGRNFMAAFRKGLEETGWLEGHNLRIDVRWGAGDRERYARYAAELISKKPDAILAATSDAVTSLQRVSRTVPVVFVGIIDPVGSGLIASMARPGGNATGFTVFEYSIASKWLELLKEMTPNLKRVAVLRDAGVSSGIGQFAAVQVVTSVDFELSVIDAVNSSDVERALVGFAAEPNGGLIVTANGFGANHPQLIATLAARLNLPAIFPFRYFVIAGGLACYGPNYPDHYRRAAGYVDRILNGAKPPDLPTQAPTKFELVVNSRTAKSIGITVPAALLARADEVIE